MPLHVSYMGTKRAIADRVAAIVQEGPPGPLLDLFSGICAVGSAVAPSRQVWCNDAQLFASTVAAAFFASSVLPIRAEDADGLARAPYLHNYRALEERFSSSLRAESLALESGNFEQLKLLETAMPNVAASLSLESERACLTLEPTQRPYRLFTITFSGSYLGLRQCIQVDSLRYAADSLRDAGRLCEHQHRWLCLALCQAASKVATTTGHFAQYVRVKETTTRRFVAQRRRSIRYEWLRAIFSLSPVGTHGWRARNKVFRGDANKLVRNLQDDGHPPAVVYADPPYTSDHYSRYYHLYETLLLYDYPKSVATGRYRPDRFVSRFSTKTQVESALRQLIEDCSKLGSRLILSYPQHGLLPNSTQAIPSMLGQYFRGRIAINNITHFHSSLGASKGRQKSKVRELVFTAG